MKPARPLHPAPCLLFLILLVAGCASRSTWQLVWSDDFETGRLDTSVWSRVTRGHSDWDNTADPDDPRLVQFRDGCLVLRGIVNDHPATDTAACLTGGIWSVGRHPFTVGERGARFVVRARLQGARGAWPAIWMMPYDDVSWPFGGEIDIMERLNHDTIAYQTVHSNYTLRLRPDLPHGGIGVIRTDSEFNDYGVDVYPDSLVFHINGHRTYAYLRDATLPDSIGQFPFFRSQHFRIDQQLGGKWVGPVSTEDLPVEMEVDWVRHYLLRKGK